MVRKTSLAGVLAVLVAGLVAGLVASGCGAGRDRGPAWPKPHEREADGGESLAPRQPAAVVAIEKSEDATPSTAAPAEGALDADGATDGPVSGTDRPAPEAPAQDPEILTTEEIVIEIED